MIEAAPPAAPIVKWVGGKTRLLPELVARMPVRFKRYYEPFAGGAALFFRVAPPRAVLADLNPDLIGCYAALARDAGAVVAQLERHQAAHDRRHYYQVRTAWNRGAPADPAARAAAFIYLTRACFNGLWRVNPAGEFNVPVGTLGIGAAIRATEALHATGAALAGATLRCCDFRVAVERAGRSDFVYFDPPYDAAAPAASFTSYTAGAFGPDQQRELAKLARVLAARGCQVMLSNRDTPLVRALYRGRPFEIHRVSCTHSVAARAAGRREEREVIIVSGYPMRGSGRAT